jgi:glycerol-3-phosphate O-acyltransferase
MAGHPYVNQISDRATQAALINAMGLISTLTARVEALEADALLRGTTIDLQGARLINLGAPQAESDAATVDFVRQVAEAQVGAF